jgi:hypothetical protein
VGGIIGICTSGCGTTGTAVVQQSGASLCVFDGSITSGDYVQNSPTVNGDCHDAGALYPSFGQVIGRVANTASGAGLYGIDLFSPEIQGKGTSVCANAAATSVSGNTTAQQIMDTCEFPAGSLNSVNKTFRLSNFFSANPSSSTSSFSWGFGTASSLGIYKVLGSQTSSSSLWNGSSQLICMVQTAGSGGTLNCTPQIEFTVPASATQTLSNFSVSVDFTQPLYIGTSCAFGTASTSNACETTTFLVEQLN